ncbi:HAMP domain-containing histidine kinase [Alkalihalobacillus sp. MEB130]|uniref:sensor histidine kinase n=1 Tax=Alkalihalobacillus sp. MEB130 TaxID=2976704 RepID=UPI0028DF69F3|nr:ATP-binding protein [Alkalihalobacillus sp. MEB130]MDT8859746.1 HAMP domain-containing histidine kinase [Alkalihalobacillus sp. MEB130]
MSISRRITLFSTVWLFVLLLLVNSGIYFLFEHITREAELSRVSAQAQSIAEVIRPDRGLTTGQTDLLTAYVPGDGMIRIIREDGSEATTITKNPALRAIPRFFTNAQQSELVQHNGKPFAMARYPLIWNDGSVVTLEYSEQMDTFESTLAILRVVLIVASLLVIVPAFFAGRALSRVLLRPIQSLIHTMEGIRKSGTFQRIEVSNQSKDELDQMGETFNRMIELLETNYDKQQQFVSDASHELRTPLTVIESYARLLKRWGMSDPDRLKEAVDAIYDESQRMKGLTKQMLSLATGEPDKTVELQRVDLSTVSRETAKKLAQAYEREILVKAQGDFFILGDEARIKQLLYILLENGLKYSSEALEMTLSHIDSDVKVDVTDYGIGIPEADLPHVFERFFRVDKTRSRQTGGSGLGLAIAKSIVEAHGGSISLTSQEEIGTTFVILLPALNGMKGMDENE